MCKMINEMIQNEFECSQEYSVLRGNSLTTKLEVLFCSKKQTPPKIIE